MFVGGSMIPVGAFVEASLVVLEASVGAAKIVAPSVMVLQPLLPLMYSS